MVRAGPLAQRRRRLGGLGRLLGNLVGVTLGNVGGGGGVALAYRFAYPEVVVASGRDRSG
ncbi:MAG TPA: hypothetical protein VMM55_07105 [Thermohalobaculum sp.]|nr:hypothetical protein [Thermohalobaculum sp.]